MDQTQSLPLRRREKAKKASGVQHSEDEPHGETWDGPVAFRGPQPLATTAESQRQPIQWTHAVRQMCMLAGRRHGHTSGRVCRQK